MAKVHAQGIKTIVMLTGDNEWTAVAAEVGIDDVPAERMLPVVAGTVILGLVYAVFSEWLKIKIRKAWAYRDLMPVI